MDNFQQLVMKIATSHQFTSHQKTHVQNRLNRFFSRYRTPDHPPYSAMIERAIVELDEDGGSSEESISRFLVKEYNDLPWAHATLLRHHLAKLCESGVIISTQSRRYALAGTNFSLNTTTGRKRKSMERVCKWDEERQLKRRRCKKQLSHKRNQQKVDEQLEVIEKHSEPNVQEKLHIEGVQGKDKYSELSDQELPPPPGYESIRLDNLSHLGNKSFHDSCSQENTIIQVQKVTSLSTYPECDQLQFGSLSSEERCKVGGKGSISVEPVIMSGQSKNSSQALVVAASKKRFHRKRLRHELLSKTLRRSSRLQNIPKPTDEEEKELNLSVVESHEELAKIEECPKLDCIQGQRRRSKRLAELDISKSEVCDLPTSNASSDLKGQQDQDGHITGKEIVLHVMQQKEPENQEPELLSEDMTEIKSSEIITYVRRKKGNFQVGMAVVSDAEKELAPEPTKTSTSLVCEDVTYLNNLHPEPVKEEASTNESQYEVRPDSRKRLRGRKRKFDDIAGTNLRFSARLRENGLLQKVENGEDASCNASALSAGDTFSPSDLVPNNKKKPHEEFPKSRRLPKR